MGVDEERDLTQQRDRVSSDRGDTTHLAPAGQPERARRLSPVVPLVTAALLIVAGFGVGQLLGVYRSGALGGTTANLALPPIPSALERDQAIATVRADATVGRINQVDAKLMTYAEYVSGAGPVRTHEGDPGASPTVGFHITRDPNATYVWVVAISGEVWPAGRSAVVFGGPTNAVATPYPPYRWATFLLDAGTGQLIVVGDAGITEGWPPTFAGLPAHPANH